MKYLVICLFSLLVTSNTFTQTQSTKEVKQCDARMARQLVERQAIESKSVSESDKRINILIRVAEYLWEKESDSARNYFAEAFKVAQERFKEKGIVNTSTVKFYYQAEPDYRFSVIRAVAKHDAEWARKLTEEVLKSYDEDKEKDKRDPFQKDQEISQSLRLAVTLFDTNQAAAIQVFRRLMNYPIVGDWFWVLYQIYGKNPQIAEQLYAELLAKQTQAPINRLLTLSAFPFGRNQTIQVNVFSSGTSAPANFTPNVNLQRQFLTVLLNRIIALTPENLYPTETQMISEAGYALAALNQLASLIAQNLPEMNSDIARARQHATALLDEKTQKALDFNKDFQERSVKNFADRVNDLEVADAKGTLTDYAIVQLILYAKTEEELKLIEPWLDKIKENSVREKSVNFFYFQSSKIALKEKRLTDARRFADRVPQIEHRAVLYFDIADEKLKEPLTKFETLEILTEVFITAEKAPDTVEKAQVLLGVAFMFEKIDRFNSVNALGKAIQTANKLENPNLFTSFVQQQIVGEKFGVFSGYSVPGFDLNRTFDQISREDFQNAISQAEGFSDRYLRTLAILASVKDCEKIDPDKIVESPKEL